MTVDIYLVLDDFGERLGPSWRGQRGSARIVRPSSAICSRANIRMLSAWSPSKRRKAGRGTFGGDRRRASVAPDRPGPRDANAARGLHRSARQRTAGPAALTAQGCRL